MWDNTPVGSSAAWKMGMVIRPACSLLLEDENTSPVSVMRGLGLNFVTPQPELHISIEGLTLPGFLGISCSSSREIKSIRSVTGINSANSDWQMMKLRSNVFGNMASFRAILIKERVPNLRVLRTLSVGTFCLYFSANCDSLSTNSLGQPVARRMLDSSWTSMGRLGMGKNILVCSYDNQSFRGKDFDAVQITRNDGWAIESSPAFIYNSWMQDSQ